MGDSTTPPRFLLWFLFPLASCRSSYRRLSIAAGYPPPASSPARPGASARRQSEGNTQIDKSTTSTALNLAEQDGSWGNRPYERFVHTAYLKGEPRLARPGEHGGGDREHAVRRHEQRGRLSRARRLPCRTERAGVVGERAVAGRAERPHVKHVAAGSWWESRGRLCLSRGWR